MPKVAIDYSKTQMYKLKHIADYDNKNIYIGHTINWIQRKSQHKCNCNNEKSKEYNQNKYQNIRKNGGWEEWEMIWIEDYPCNNKREAEAREEYWRSELKATLNTIRSFRTKEEKKEYLKVYRENNKDKIKEVDKLYRENKKLLVVK